MAIIDRGEQLVSRLSTRCNPTCAFIIAGSNVPVRLSKEALGCAIVVYARVSRQSLFRCGPQPTYALSPCCMYLTPSLICSASIFLLVRYNEKGKRRKKKRVCNSNEQMFVSGDEKDGSWLLNSSNDSGCFIYNNYAMRLQIKASQNKVQQTTNEPECSHSSYHP